MDEKTKSKTRGWLAIGAVCLAFVLITTTTLSGTLAKFISSVTGTTNEVPAAQFNFNNAYLGDPIEWELTNMGASSHDGYSTKTLYPGQSGMMKFDVSFISDVKAQAFANCELTYSGAFEDKHLRDLVSLKFVVSESNQTPDFTANTVKIDELENAIETALVGTIGTDGDYSTLGTKIDKTVYVHWNWGFELNNSADTQFANKAAQLLAANSNNESTVGINVDMAVVQADMEGNAENPLGQLPESLSVSYATMNSIVVDTENSKCVEYSIDGQTWQDSNVFANLEKATEYTIHARIKGTTEEKSVTYSTASALYQDTESGFYILGGKDDLDAFSTFVNADAANTSAFAKLIADIEYNDTSDYDSWTAEIGPANNFTPIGKSYSYYFKGTLDGQGYTIRGLYISNDTLRHNGLVGYMETNGVICNLNLEDAYINATYSTSSDAACAGGFASYLKGTIYNCSFDGVVKCTSTTGGIAGMCTATSSIYNCSSSGELTTTMDRSFVNGTAGIAGSGQGTISNCYNEASVSGKTASGILGILSYNENVKIENCVNAGMIEGTSRKGEIYGNKQSGATATIDNCFSMDAATGTCYTVTDGITRGAEKTQEEVLTALNGWINQNTDHAYKRWAADGNYIRFEE